MDIIHPHLPMGSKSHLPTRRDKLLKNTTHHHRSNRTLRLELDSLDKASTLDSNPHYPLEDTAHKA